MNFLAHLLNLILEPGFSSGEPLLLFDALGTNTSRIGLIGPPPLLLLPLPLHLQPLLGPPLLLLGELRLDDLELGFPLGEDEIHAAMAEAPQRQWIPQRDRKAREVGEVGESAGKSLSGRGNGLGWDRGEEAMKERRKLRAFQPLEKGEASRH